MMRVIVALWTAAVLVVLQGTSSSSAEPLPWPREVVGPSGARIVLYQPQVDGWDNLVTLRFRLAAELYMPGETKPTPAALQMQAATKTDLQQRSVMASDIKVVGVKISGIDQTLEARLRAVVDSYISGMTQPLALDTVLAAVERGGATARPEDAAVPVANLHRPKVLVGDTPTILVSKTPSVLVLFDGEPVFAELDDARLEFAVNTNWDIFRHKTRLTRRSTYYLLNEETWLEASSLAGPWAPADDLPGAFQDLPATESFAAARENIPGAEISEDDIPQVYVSYEPAELIVIEGEPAEEPIPGTDVAMVTNTDSSLFRSKADGAYYYLVSGRWFRAASLDGQWTDASAGLPEGFADIPADHKAAEVRVSVRGTPEAEEAVLLASVPQKAEINRRDAKVAVAYYGEPKF